MTYIIQFPSSYFVQPDWTTKVSEFESNWGQEFSLLHVVQTGYEIHPTSYPIRTGGSFPGGKATGT
jgi:hypothetical protein